MPTEWNTALDKRTEPTGRAVNFKQYLIVLTEMQYFHIRFHIALPSPVMTTSEVLQKAHLF